MKKENISSLRTYISSKEAQWFRISLAFIIAFFIFTWIVSDNILILFIKRATTLIFTFLIPGYVITKAIYPRENEINVIEQFAFSVAFSLTFIMFAGYILNYVWVITRFSLAITAFVLAIIFAFIALRRTHTCSKQSTEEFYEKEITKSTIFSLIIIGAAAFALNSYDPIMSPIIGGIDSYNWVKTIQSIINDKHASPSQILLWYGYPAGFPLIITFLKIFLNINTYDIMRYITIFSFLNVFPTFILSFYIFRSKYISFLAMVLMMSTKWIFSKSTEAVPQLMIHFFLILFLFMLLKTLEKPNLKNSLITSVLLSSSILLYHYEMLILIIFTPLIFLLVCSHIVFIKKSYNRCYNILKSGLLILITSALISGLLWYFRALNTLVNTYFKEGIKSTIAGINPQTYMYILYDGWMLILFSAVGLLFIFLRPQHLKKIEYQFLLLYFFVILFIIEKIPSLVNRGGWTATYIFTYLTFPLSMLAGYGIFNFFSPIIKKADSQIRNKVFALLLLTVFVLNVSFINYSNHPNADIHKLNKRIDEGNYKSIFFQDYIQTKQITLNEYNAFNWISKNTHIASNVISWDGKPVFQKVISERGILWISNLNISNSTSTELMKKTYPWASKGLDLYILTGLSHDELALRRAKGSDFSNETLKLIAQDPNFNLVYQNPQIKIYRIESKNYTVLLDVE